MKRFWNVVGLLGGMGCVSLGIFILLSDRPTRVETRALVECNKQQAVAAAWGVCLQRYYGDLREVVWRTGIHSFLEKAPLSHDPLVEQRLQDALNHWPVSSIPPQGLVLSAGKSGVIATTGDSSGFGALSRDWQAQNESGFAVVRALDGSSSPLALVLPEEPQDHQQGRLWALYPPEASLPFVLTARARAHWPLVDAQGHSLVGNGESPWVHGAMPLMALLHSRGSGVLPLSDGSILAHCSVTTGGSAPLLLYQILYPTQNSGTKIVYATLGLGAILILLAGLRGSRARTEPKSAGDDTAHAESARSNRTSFRDILPAVDDPIFVTDNDGRVIRANRAATMLLGLREGGRPARDLRVACAGRQWNAGDFLARLAANPALATGKTLLVNSSNRTWHGHLWVTPLSATEATGGRALFHLHRTDESSSSVTSVSEPGDETAETPVADVHALGENARGLAETLPIGTPIRKR